MVRLSCACLTRLVTRGMMRDLTAAVCISDLLSGSCAVMPWLEWCPDPQPPEAQWVKVFHPGSTYPRCRKTPIHADTMISVNRQGSGRGQPLRNLDHSRLAAPRVPEDIDTAGVICPPQRLGRAARYHANHCYLHSGGITWSRSTPSASA